jgi:hypothetical protein
VFNLIVLPVIRFLESEWIRDLVEGDFIVGELDLDFGDFIRFEEVPERLVLMVFVLREERRFFSSYLFFKRECMGSITS